MEEELNDEESTCKDVSWAAYHANNTKTYTTNMRLRTLQCYLFKEQAHSPAMIKHSLSVILKAVELLNPATNCRL